MSRFTDSLRIEPTGESDPSVCDCCGCTSRTVMGLLHEGDVAAAAYFVQWTVEQPEHGANFDLILGAWGEDTDAADRVAVSLEYQAIGASPGFMVIDASSRPVGESDLVGHALARDEVVGAEFADMAFAAVDAIWLQDERLRELTDPS